MTPNAPKNTTANLQRTLRPKTAPPKSKMPLQRSQKVHRLHLKWSRRSTRLPQRTNTCPRLTTFPPSPPPRPLTRRPPITATTAAAAAATTTTTTHHRHLWPLDSSPPPPQPKTPPRGITAAPLATPLAPLPPPGGTTKRAEAIATIPLFLRRGVGEGPQSPPKLGGIGIPVPLAPGIRLVPLSPGAMPPVPHRIDDPDPLTPSAIVPGRRPPQGEEEEEGGGGSRGRHPDAISSPDPQDAPVVQSDATPGRQSAPRDTTPNPGSPAGPLCDREDAIRRTQKPAGTTRGIVTGPLRTDGIGTALVGAGAADETPPLLLRSKPGRVGRRGR